MTRLGLRRWKWDWPSPWIMQDEKGLEIDLTMATPQLLKWHLKESRRPGNSNHSETGRTQRQIPASQRPRNRTHKEKERATSAGSGGAPAPMDADDEQQEQQGRRSKKGKCKGKQSEDATKTKLLLQNTQLTRILMGSAMACWTLDSSVGLVEQALETARILQARSMH